MAGSLGKTDALDCAYWAATGTYPSVIAQKVNKDYQVVAKAFEAYNTKNDAIFDEGVS